MNLKYWITTHICILADGGTGGEGGEGAEFMLIQEINLYSLVHIVNARTTEVPVRSEHEMVRATCMPV